MKKTGWKSLLLLMALTSLVGCSSADDYRGKVAVSLYRAEHVFVSQPLQYVSRGSDVTFSLSIDNGYSLTDTSYQNYSLLAGGNNTYSLVLEKIAGPVKVSLTIEKNDSTITYYANGGSVKSGGDYFTQSYNLTNHKRANTSHGVNDLTRDGYSLVGWNTKADLSGETIGLGSRVSIPESGFLDLYAVWKEWNDASDFSYSVVNGQAILEGYQGNHTDLVLPETLDGYPLVTISKDSFAQQNFTSLVLPYTVEHIAKNAFSDVTIQDLYFSDSLWDVSDDSFAESVISHIHINAYRDPVYVTNNRHSFYADKVDLLILSLEEDKPRMVFEGDSGIWFNLNGETIRNAFPDYTVVNLGLNGFFNAQVQYAALLPYLRKDDVFIHVPAPNSAYQMLVKTSMTENMYTSLELNYDLFSYMDITRMDDVFDSYASYLSVKMTMTKEDYQDICPTHWIDESGCIPFYLPAINSDEDLGDDAYIDASLFTEESMQRINDFYEEVNEITQNQVLFGFGATNYDGLSEAERNTSYLESFETEMKTKLSTKVTVLDHMKDNVLRGHNFYNTDFHLNTDAGKEYTKTLAEHIKEVLA